jgi:hypothetical protein
MEHPVYTVAKPGSFTNGCFNPKRKLNDGMRAILGEEIHKLNEKMITEIDNYEKESLESFNNKFATKEKELDEILVNIAKFYAANCKYLKEFVIED